MKAHWIPQMNRAGTARRYVLNLGDGYKAYVSKDANTDGRTYLWAIMGPRLWPAGQVQQDGIIHLRDESNGHAFQTKEAAMLDFEKIMPRWKREFRHLLPMQEKPPIVESTPSKWIKDIENIRDIQHSDPISKTDPYMRGMANALEVVWSIISDEEPCFIEGPLDEARPTWRKGVPTGCCEVEGAEHCLFGNKALLIYPDAFGSAEWFTVEIIDQSGEILADDFVKSGDISTARTSAERLWSKGSWKHGSDGVEPPEL